MGIDLRSNYVRCRGNAASGQVCLEGLSQVSESVPAQPWRDTRTIRSDTDSRAESPTTRYGYGRALARAGDFIPEGQGQAIQDQRAYGEDERVISGLRMSEDQFQRQV